MSASIKNRFLLWIHNSFPYQTPLCTISSVSTVFKQSKSTFYVNPGVPKLSFIFGRTWSWWWFLQNDFKIWLHFPTLRTRTNIFSGTCNILYSVYFTAEPFRECALTIYILEEIFFLNHGTVMSVRMCICVCMCRFCNMCVCEGFVMCGCFGNMYTVLWLMFFLTWLRFFFPWLRFFSAFSSVVRQMPG